MIVSIRNIAAVAALGLLSSTAAYAGGMGGSGCCGTGNFNGGITNIPTIPAPAGGGCCGSVNSQIVAVPGVYVPSSNVNVTVGGANIGGSNIMVGGTNYNVTTSVFGGGGGGSSGGYYIGGGGGSYNSVAPVSPGLIDGMAVGGEAAMESYMETRTTTEVVAIRAVCMDDRMMPHPASRPSSDEQVAATFDGEIFRCMAGTRMEVTIGRMVDGRAVWDGGSSMSCQKGQALSHKGGQLTCTAQIAQRNCNERSLLRRFGPGIKYVTLTRTQQVQSQRQSSQYTSFRSSMFIDGGVGQGVY